MLRESGGAIRSESNDVPPWLSGTTQGHLTQGTTLTRLKDTAATPISGTFSNLPDGRIVNGNNLQASYSGGDGNDLTLTVVP